MVLTPTTICLNMIVKNEAEIITKTFDNLFSYIQFDYWVICDTGSTDNTTEIITQYFKNKNIPGELFSDEWKDFAHNRSLALERAYNKTDYLLIFDADDSIHDDFKLPEIFEFDKYDLKFGKDFTYYRPLLINNRKRWKYKGVLHEFLCDMETINGSCQLKGNYFINSGRTGNRSKNPNKYYDDAIILKNAFFNEPEEGLKNRYAFYCAQSYKDSRNVDEAIEWYKKCLTLNNWTQEKYYSCIMLYELYKSKNNTNDSFKYAFKSIEYDNERIEGIIFTMRDMNSVGHFLLVNSLYHKFKNYKKEFKHKLFLYNYLYNDELEYENTVAAYYVNDCESGYECCKKILVNKLIGYSKMRVTLNNIQFYKEHINNDNYSLELFYAIDDLFKEMSIKNEIIEKSHIETWELLFNKNINNFIQNKVHKNRFKNKENPKIIITFTTCKRLDLFQKTVNSILNTWMDIDKIDYWFCVDDNSSEEDRVKMKEMYTWIEYFMKTPEEKGHRKSMNIIWDKLQKIKPTYWIHMEDDFLFYKNMNYIEQAIKGLELFKEEKVCQILFNINYGETISNYNIKGHIQLNNDFSMHNYKSGNFPYNNCHYWPHYSFRPSMILTDAVLNLGNFDSTNTFFEMDYANKWANAGYKSAFFSCLTNRHIGRLTSQINNNIKNAYNLNNEEQFTNSKQYDNNDNSNNNNNNFIHTKDSTINVVTKSFVKIVNLHRREDRKNQMTQTLKEINISEQDFEFVKAVDGTKIKPSLELYNLFKNNDFGSRRGVIGCALSHYYLWKELLKDNDNNFYLILEDDIRFCKNFKAKIDNIVKEMKNKDVVFFGYSIFKKSRDSVRNIYDIESDNINICILDKTYYIGGTFAYIINKKGAEKLVNHIEINGIKHGIDYLMKEYNELNCYETQPHLVFSEFHENENVDTDIQRDFNAIDLESFDIEEIKLTLDELKEQFVFLPEKDQTNYDIYFLKNSIEKNLKLALIDEKCVAVNTLGFFKNKIYNFTCSPYFGKNDGIYIKKQIYNDYLNIKKNENIRVKMICNWCTSEQLCKEWSNMCEQPSKFSWKNIQITWENTDIDYYVIINKPLFKDEYFEPNKTIIFQMEPYVFDHTKNWGVKTWGEWCNPDPLRFLAVRGRHTKYHNNAFWQLEQTYNELVNLNIEAIDKKNNLSSICSSKYFDEGHIKRIDFLKYIESKNDIPIDIYSQDNKHNFYNNKGPLQPYIDKSKGLLPYKYYFMIENNFEENFITEKLWEPILCETLVFYYGCPNTSDYIDPLAYVELDINNFEKSYQIIKNAIEQDLWSQRIDIIKKEKQKILNELSFFPTVQKIIEEDKKKSF